MLTSASSLASALHTPAQASDLKENLMNEPSRVLVVDDEPQITRVLRTVLASQGHLVRTAVDGASALVIFNDWRPHLVLTDLCMPHMDGVELCRRIRSVSAVPIIVLSVRGSEPAKVEALDAGADDHVTKPFGTDELLARVRAMLRRSRDEDEMAPLEIGEFRIDLQARRVYVRGSEVRLTPKEFDLFVYLARRPNRVIEHRRLLEAVWGQMAQDHPEYLRVFMGQLRKKLEPNPSEPRHLATEPWVGYRFNPSA
jgi:two-component system KDP operon response regulator KdpE